MEYTCKCVNIKPKDDMDGLSDIVVASFDIECDSLTGEFPRAIKDFKGLATNIYDNYNNWYDPTFDNTSKIDIVKEYIRQAFSTEDLGFKNDIDHIITENGLPQLDHLDFINIEIIKDLNDSLNDKKKEMI